MSEYSDYYEEHGLRTTPIKPTPIKVDSSIDHLIEYVLAQEEIMNHLSDLTPDDLTILAALIRTFKRVIDMHRAYRKDD